MGFLCKIGLHSVGFARKGRPKESLRKVLSFSHAVCEDCGEEVYWDVRYYHPLRIPWLRKWLCDHGFHIRSSICSFKGKDLMRVGGTKLNLDPKKYYYYCNGCDSYVEDLAR